MTVRFVNRTVIMTVLVFIMTVRFCLKGGKSEFLGYNVKMTRCSRDPGNNVRPRASKTVLGPRATLYGPRTVLEALGRTLFPGSLEQPGHFIPLYTVLVDCFGWLTRIWGDPCRVSHNWNYLLPKQDGGTSQITTKVLNYHGHPVPHYVGNYTINHSIIFWYKQSTL